MGKIIPLPDIEYIHWCNINKELLEKLLNTGTIDKRFFNENRSFVQRFLAVHGYTIQD